MCGAMAFDGADARADGHRAQLHGRPLRGEHGARRRRCRTPSCSSASTMRRTSASSATLDRRTDVRIGMPVVADVGRAHRRGRHRDPAAAVASGDVGAGAPTRPAELDAGSTTTGTPTLTVGAWWELLGGAGWAAPTLPPDRCGTGVTVAEGDAIAAGSASAACSGRRPGPGWRSSPRPSPPTPTPSQVDALLRPIVTGATAWCLLFSEPGAGTDLASLTTTATPDGDGWRLDGRKTWATGAHLADMAIVLARTGPRRQPPPRADLLRPRHAPRATGIEVRPMREMTGRALSNDVTLDGAWVPADRVIGDVGDGWAVVNVALTSERRTVGAHRSSPAVAGSRSGDLDRPAGEVAGPPAPGPARRRCRPTRSPGGSPARRAVPPCARTWPGCTRPSRSPAGRRPGRRPRRRRPRRCRAPPTSPSCGPARSPAAARRSPSVRSAPGARCTPTTAPPPDDDEAAAAGDGDGLGAPAVSLVGGVDLVQRDLLGERVLGLPVSRPPESARRPDVRWPAELSLLRSRAGRRRPAAGKLMLRPSMPWLQEVGYACWFSRASVVGPHPDQVAGGVGALRRPPASARRRRRNRRQLEDALARRERLLVQHPPRRRPDAGRDLAVGASWSRASTTCRRTR